MRRISRHRLACVVFAIIMGLFGIFHLYNAENMKSIVPDYVPGGIVWVYISGAGFILASIAILVDRYTKTACYMLAGMLLIFIFLIHVPVVVSGESEIVKQTGLLMMLKDIGLVMAALLVGYNSNRPDGVPNL